MAIDKINVVTQRYYKNVVRGSAVSWDYSYLYCIAHKK